MMKKRSIDLIEATVVVIGNYLSFRTFFNYRFVSNMLPSDFLYPIWLLSSIITLYFIREEITSLYLINLALYLPEAISFSGMNWIINYGKNLLEPSSLSLSTFKTQMSFNESLAIGLVLVSGYALLLLISKLKETNRKMKLRGETSEKNEILSSRQLNFILIIMTVSLIVTVGISISVENISNYINQFI